MFKTQDVIDSFLSCLSWKPKQRYQDKVRASLKQPNKWENRAIKSSLHTLAAVCFKEVSTSNYKESNSFIFPPIGFYYSVFHLSVSLLALDINTELSELKEIHHGRLFNLIESRLVSTKVLNTTYLENFKVLRELRESSNYRFGYSPNHITNVKNAEKLADENFDSGLVFLHKVLEITGMRLRFTVGIGEGFGDGILDTYLSEEEKENVSLYLVTNGLTT
jgi:hypothetical protein